MDGPESTVWIGLQGHSLFPARVSRHAEDGQDSVSRRPVWHRQGRDDVGEQSAAGSAARRAGWQPAANFGSTDGSTQRADVEAAPTARDVVSIKLRLGALVQAILKTCLFTARLFTGSLSRFSR